MTSLWKPCDGAGGNEYMKSTIACRAALSFAGSNRTSGCVAKTDARLLSARLLECDAKLFSGDLWNGFTIGGLGKPGTMLEGTDRTIEDDSPARGLMTDVRILLVFSQLHFDEESFSPVVAHAGRNDL